MGITDACDEALSSIVDGVGVKNNKKVQKQNTKEKKQDTSTSKTRSRVSTSGTDSALDRSSDIGDSFKVVDEMPQDNNGKAKSMKSQKDDQETVKPEVKSKTRKSVPAKDKEKAKSEVKSKTRKSVPAK